MGLLISDAYAQTAGGRWGAAAWDRSSCWCLRRGVLLPVDPAAAKSMKDQQAMLSRLSTGMSGHGRGILGAYRSGDPFITLEDAEGVRIKVQKSAGLAADALRALSRALKAPESIACWNFRVGSTCWCARDVRRGSTGRCRTYSAKTRRCRSSGKDRAPMDDQARQSIAGSAAQAADRHPARLHRQRPPDRCLNDVASQIKARTPWMPTLADIDRFRRCPMPPARRLDAQARLKAMPLGLDLRAACNLLYQVDVNGAVSQLLAATSRASAVAWPRPRSLHGRRRINSGAGQVTDGLRVTLPPGSDTSAVTSACARSTTR